MPASHRVRPAHLWLARLLLTGSLAVLAACGGGGESSNGGSSTIPAHDWVAGVFQPPGLYANLCAAPRTGTNPATGKPFPDQIGRTLDENNWLRSWTNDNYLWYSEVQDRDPALYSTLDYFGLLKTTALTPSGAPKDRFHYAYRSTEWDALSVAGTSPGYGMQWAWLQSSPPRALTVAYTEPGSPATAADVNITRGARVLAVNAIDLVNENSSAGVTAINAALYPSTAGVNTQLTILDAGATVPRTVTLRSAQVTSTPVQNVKTFEGPNGRTVGYLLFNDHIETAELQLAQGLEQLRQKGATELVVDLRYNSGGYLFLASQLAYMIAGDQNTRGKVFERLLFNDKVQASGGGNLPTPFYSTGRGYSVPEGVPLPSLDLRRVYVLTGANTCSASESLINSLRGIDIEVVQIGATTCGKPYGFYPESNCGSTYFSILFKGENAKGFSDYTDGMPPVCDVPDDFAHALGDVQEARLAAALTYMATGACPAPAAAPVASARGMRMATTARPEPLLHKPEGLSNRILRAP